MPFLAALRRKFVGGAAEKYEAALYGRRWEKNMPTLLWGLFCCCRRFQQGSFHIRSKLSIPVLGIPVLGLIPGTLRNLAPAGCAGCLDFNHTAATKCSKCPDRVLYPLQWLIPTAECRICLVCLRWALHWLSRTEFSKHPLKLRVGTDLYDSEAYANSEKRPKFGKTPKTRKNAQKSELSTADCR